MECAQKRHRTTRNERCNLMIVTASAAPVIYQAHAKRLLVHCHRVSAPFGAFKSNTSGDIRWPTASATAAAAATGAAATDNDNWAPMATVAYAV